jgi:hypothetical protein
MFRYPLHRHLLVSFSVAVVTAALGGGCSDNVQATPRVTFESTISPGRHTSMECTQTGTWFTIGSFGNPALGHQNPADDQSPLVDPVRPVDDGGDDQQGKASVSCSVVEAGEGFDVALHAELSGATGGAMTLTGHIKRQDTSPGVSLATTRKGETYNGSANCTVTFNTAVGHAIAGGRVWALIDCPDAEAPSQQRICATHSEFRFENCTQ